MIWKWALLDIFSFWKNRNTCLIWCCVVRWYNISLWFLCMFFPIIINEVCNFYFNEGLITLIRETEDFSYSSDFHVYLFVFSSVQWLSRVWLFATPWITARQASLSITNSRSSPKLTSAESVMPFSHLILCHPFLLLPPIPPSIRVFSNESTLRMRWPKYGSFSFSIIPSKEHPEPISFRMDWVDLLAVQGTSSN